MTGVYSIYQARGRCTYKPRGVILGTDVMKQQCAFDKLQTMSFKAENASIADSTTESCQTSIAAYQGMLKEEHGEH